MWYRFSQFNEEDNSEADRQMLDMTGGVRTRPGQSTTPTTPTTTEPKNITPIEKEPETQEITDALDTEDAPDVPDVPDTLDDNSNSNDTFTDYTPPSSEEENQVEKAQDMYRAEDLAAIMDGAGVIYPVHDSCRCRIQFRPDESSIDLLVPRWEISPGACGDCIQAQKSFNQYVEQTGVRVQPPSSVNV